MSQADAAPENRLVAMLALEPAGEDGFIASTPDPGKGPARIFGGHIASQALRAASLTVGPELSVHSAHAYFLRPGRPGEPLHLDVRRLRDGRTSATRQVTTIQAGVPIFGLMASFHAADEGDDWQASMPVDAPDPDDIDPATSFLGQMWGSRTLDVRGIHPWQPGTPPTIHPVWLRSRASLPNDPSLHAAALMFLSDMGVAGSVLPPGTSFDDGVTVTSLDHAIWFHRAFRVDDWILFAVDPVSRSGGRGLAHGSMRTRDGRLVASIAQEILVRQR
jgi:acyl-CoA thioesterase II